MKFGNYNFIGPLILDQLGPWLLKHAGVYIITRGDFAVLDVGESDDINRRVTVDHKYERDPSWRLYTGGISPFVFGLIEYNQRKRLEIERELRALFNPPCGVR